MEKTEFLSKEYIKIITDHCNKVENGTINLEKDIKLTIGNVSKLYDISSEQIKINGLNNIFYILKDVTALNKSNGELKEIKKELVENNKLLKDALEALHKLQSPD